MIARLRTVRLTRGQLAAIAGTSTLATALIIATAFGRTPVQSAAIAALHRRAIVVAAASGQPGGGASPDASASPQVLAAADTPSPTTAAASPATSGAASAGSDSSSDAGSSSASTTSGDSDTTTGSSTTPSTPPPTKVKHVFVIALSTTSFEAAFGKGSVAQYLNHTLRPKGTLLRGYETLGDAELPDYLAMVSGQAPDADTRAECPIYTDFASSAKLAADGQVPGDGCVYPDAALTIGDQVTAAGKVWKGFIDDMGTSTCVAPNDGAANTGPFPHAGSDYSTLNNPFIYFHSLLDLGGCAEDDVSLDQLPGALRSASSTPTFSFIAPDACLDASAQTCPDGTPAGIAGEDAFLKQWVPSILGSAAYKKNGALIIVFAHAPTSGAVTDPDKPVRTGALVLSQYGRRDKTLSATYNPYSLLRSVEDLLGYESLARAKTASSFVADALPGAGG